MSAVGIRLHRSGSIYSRIRDLIKAGVLQTERRPLWFDVYEAFPPIREPVYLQETDPDQFGLINVKEDVKTILYEEDWARAMYNIHHRKVSHFNQRDITSMFIVEESKYKNSSEKFVEHFKEFQKRHITLANEEIFEKTLKYLDDSENIP